MEGVGRSPVNWKTGNLLVDPRLLGEHYLGPDFSYDIKRELLFWGGDKAFWAT